MLPLRFSWRARLAWTCLVAGGVGLSFSPATTRAQDEKPKTRLKATIATDEDEKKSEEKTDPFALPADGSPEDIAKALEKLQRYRPDVKTRDEVIEHLTKVQKVTIEGTQRILDAKDVEAETALKAARLKLNAHMMMARLGDEGAEDQAKQAAEKLSRDARPEVAKLGEEAVFMFRIMGAAELPADERDRLAKDVLDRVKSSEFSRPAVSGAMQLAGVLEQMPDTAPAVDFMGSLADLVEKAEDEQIQNLAPRLRGTVRRMALLGNAMEVKGTTLEGKPFDVADWKGKVVLVDFWATWCGPCVAEIPNVKKLYEAYHDKGFEIVGISLDDERAPLDEFVKEREIPWPNLYPKAGDDDKGWDNPIARQYGISAIPTCILINAEGKVVSLNARGSVLESELEKLLGPAPKSEKAEAKEEDK